ncbi:hypothetical protein BB558_003121 [Smittium angustum]|uniref:Uncharacterized protein n=1 Tax=Smittium angustum TaxID=133377 RepID=A0A2U1J6U7_SMIAN|nr:hypothetical protein BB558_003121 [Smittium angustum]
MLKNKSLNNKHLDVTNLLRLQSVEMERTKPFRNGHQIKYLEPETNGKDIDQFISMDLNSKDCIYYSFKSVLDT